LRIGELARELGWIERRGAGEWSFGLREPAEADEELPLILESAEDEPVLVPPRDWEVIVSLAAGSNEASVRVLAPDPYVVAFVDGVLAAARAGDPNRNGVYGADDPNAAGALIVPGSPAKSYLFGRITGSVPGTRMPLANQPLSNAEYAAIACFIEGLDPDGDASALDEIDYDRCLFAKSPIEYVTSASE
jgi:hypothetical protein